MRQHVQGQDPHPVLEVSAVGGDDVALVVLRRQLLQGFTDAAHQLGGLAAGLVQHLPAALHPPLQSVQVFGAARRRLRPDVRLRGLADGRFWRGADGALLRFSGVLLREAGPGFTVVTV